MKQTLIGFLSTALWLAAGPLCAQTSGEGTKEESLLALQEQSGDTVTKQSRETMQEHIAVFRVLLNRSLEKTYGFPPQAPGPHHGMAGGFSRAGGVREEWGVGAALVGGGEGAAGRAASLFPSGGASKASPWAARGSSTFKGRRRRRTPRGPRPPPPRARR